MSPELVEDFTEIAKNANYAFQTYNNYIRSWIILFETLYGPQPDGIGNFIEKIKGTVELSQLTKDYKIPDDFRDSYHRGRLTWGAIQSLPIADNPALAIPANYWLPVQAYYAVNGFGNACLILLNQAHQVSHSGFKRQFSEVIQPYLLEPLCTGCSGGPEKEKFEFTKLGVTASAVISQSNLETPNKDNSIKYVGKCLSTTRQQAIDKKFTNKKKSEKRRSLKYGEKCTACAAIPSISICDFLYRMRENSNYDSPDMYIHADNEDAVHSYNDLRYLTEIIITNLKTILEIRLGTERMAQL